MKKILLFFAAICCINFHSYAQDFIYQLMERTDIKVEEAAIIAQHYFDSVGTSRKTGFKHFQRWLYERRFHVDENGYYIQPKTEWQTWQQTNPVSARNPVRWYENGPWGWSYTSGWNPGTGRITNVAIHPSDESIIYVTSPGGGIWKSINYGASWTPLQDNNSLWMDMYSITIDPSNVNTIYAGNSSGAVEKSVDAGVTWSTLSVGSTGAVMKIAVHPTNSNIVFVCSSAGIHRSINGGSTWTLVHSTQKEDIEFKPDNPNIMYASGNTNIIRSTDNGINWTVLGSADGITNAGRTLLGVTPSDPNVVYALQANNSTQEFRCLYRSSNAGISFTVTVTGGAGAGRNYFGYSPLGTDAGGQATYDMGICVSPTNANEIVIAGIICWRSTNGGTSFAAATEWSYPNTTGYNHADVHGLQWINSTIYSNSDGGIFKSIDNADNWINISLGLGIRQFYRIACSQTDVNVITGGAQDNGSVTRKSTGNWVDWLGADGMEGLVSPTNSLNLWGTSQNGSIYKSTNGGNSYSNLTRPSTGQWVTPLAIHPTDETILYGGWTGFYKSTNGGTNWTKLSGSTISSALTDIAIAPSDVNYLYASVGSTLYVSTNGGSSWTTRTAPASISDIAVHRTIPDKIYITCTSTSNNVYVSADAGATFTNISTGLPTVAARAVVVENNFYNGIYIGMNTGVYYKNDTMATWFSFTGNLPAVAVNELEIQYASRRIRVATYGRGVWETALFSDYVLLPVKWLSFIATKETNAVHLKWNVSGENANTRYEVEKSLDGASFATIGSLKNRGKSTADYQIKDSKPQSGIQYYRIKEMTDGQVNYSSIVAVMFGDKQEQLIINPNPVVGSNLRFSFTKANTEDFEINIVDAAGRIMLVHKQKDAVGNLNIGYMPSGTYVFVIKQGTEKTTTQFVKAD